MNKVFLMSVLVAISSVSCGILEEEPAEEMTECELRCEALIGDAHVGCVNECEGPLSSEIEQAARIEAGMKSVADCKALIGYPHSTLCGDEEDVCACAEAHEAWDQECNGQFEYCKLTVVPWSEIPNLERWDFDQCAIETPDNPVIRRFCTCLLEKDGCTTLD